VEVGEDERALWAEAQRELARLQQEDLLVADEKLGRYLDGVLAELLPELAEGAPQPRAFVLRSPERNAGTTADGMVFVSTSFLAALGDEAELAALFGHEIAHFLARDSLADQRFAQLSSSTVQRMELSRDQEERADRVGLDLMRQAGYDPAGALRMLELLERDDAEARGPYPRFESHPFVPDRIRALRPQLPREAGEGRRETERYEDAIADLLLVAAEIELEAGLLDRANAAIDRHLRLRPGSGRGYFLKAEHERRIAREGRRAPAARSAYERAVELAPEDPDALRALGFLCRETGERQRAMELFGRYLRVAPDAADRKIIERYLGEDAGDDGAQGRAVER
jgi:predicted Zn-dependent protease